MKILQLCPKIPYPLTDGGSIGIFNITKELSLLGHEVHMIALSRNGKYEPDELLQYCSLTTIPLDSKTSVPGAIAALFSLSPYTTRKYWNSDVERQIVDIAAQGDFDLVHSDHLHMARYGQMVSDELGIPLVIREHNLEAVIVERFYQVQRNPLIKMYAYVEKKRLAVYERNVCGLAALNVMITADDEARLKSMNPDVRTIVAPAGVDTEYYQSTQPALADQSDSEISILSIASMDWKPNIDAVLWFCDEVLPKILDVNPSAVFKIIGRGIPPEVQKRSSPNVEIVGFVEDVRPDMERATVMVVPLRIGGGMRLKILDALAMKKAVVSTPIGCEGIDVMDGVNISVAANSTEFAASVSTLLRDANLRLALGESGRELVESQYSWATIVSCLAKEYQSVIDRYG
jgi:polysaccharide biosynthesis protein PslH